MKQQKGGKGIMSQNFEMKINPLPAKTWNWLHMNGTVLKEEIITERGTVKADGSPRQADIQYLTPDHCFHL